MVQYLRVGGGGITEKMKGQKFQCQAFVEVLRKGISTAAHNVLEVCNRPRHAEMCMLKWGAAANGLLELGGAHGESKCRAWCHVHCSCTGTWHHLIVYISSLLLSLIFCTTLHYCHRPLMDWFRLDKAAWHNSEQQPK